MTFLKTNKVVIYVLSKYRNLVNIILLNIAVQFLEYMTINNYFINYINNQ